MANATDNYDHEFEFDSGEENQRRYTLWERLAGPITSALVHVVLLVILALTVTAVVMQDETPEEQTFEMIQPKMAKLDKPIDLPDEPNEPTDLPPSVFLPDFVTDVSTTELQAETTSTDPVEVDRPDISIISDAPSVIVMKSLYAGRTPAGRRAALDAFGGGGSDPSVVRALNWLHRNQIKDGKKAGTWPTSEGSGAAMAGLGLLTFLAHNELPTSKRYGSTVQLTIDYLVRTQKDNGQWEEKGSHEYGHAIATYAVSEAYSMTKHPSLKYVMEKGVGRIIDGTILEKFPARESMRKISPYDRSGDRDNRVNLVTGCFWNYDYADGAWKNGYENNYMNGATAMQPVYRNGVRKDHSFMGFQMQALKAAQVAECENPKLDETIRLAVNGMKFMHSVENGSFAYSSQASTPNSSTGTANQLGVGSYCLQLLDGPNSPEAKRSIKALYRAGFDPQSNRSFYRMYYRANANFRVDGMQRGGPGPNWTQYNTDMKPWLIENQNADGSWTHTSVGQADTHDLVYPTCLGALTLSVYSRYLVSSSAPPRNPIPENAVRDVRVKVSGSFEFEKL